jgi:hypothetical protein
MFDLSLYRFDGASVAYLWRRWSCSSSPLSWLGDGTCRGHRAGVSGARRRGVGVARRVRTRGHHGAPEDVLVRSRLSGDRRGSGLFLSGVQNVRLSSAASFGEARGRRVALSRSDGARGGHELLSQPSLVLGCHRCVDEHRHLRTRAVVFSFRGLFLRTGLSRNRPLRLGPPDSSRRLSGADRHNSCGEPVRSSRKRVLSLPFLPAGLDTPGHGSGGAVSLSGHDRYRMLDLLPIARIFWWRSWTTGCW